MKRIIEEKDFDFIKFNEWCKTVQVVKYEHDYEKQIYIIDYKDEI